jgi:hypothetical protein
VFVESSSGEIDLLMWSALLTGLVLIWTKAFTDLVSGDGGGTHWALFFPVVGTIAGHQTIVPPELGVKTLSVADV